MVHHHRRPSHNIPICVCIVHHEAFEVHLGDSIFYRGGRQYRTGVVCGICQNPRHYVQGDQMKQCTNCNILVHNTNKCMSERHEAQRPPTR